jgi:hypothetical protein
VIGIVIDDKDLQPEKHSSSKEIIEFGILMGNNDEHRGILSLSMS